MTTDGYRSVFSQSLPIISNTNTFKNSYEYSVFNKFSNDMVGNVTFYVAAVNGITGKDVKVSERLNLSQNKLKGFERGRVGPVDSGDYIGGNYASSINVSTSLPMFFQSLDSADISYFIDLGNVWAVDYSSEVNDGSKIRSSTGLVVNWFTPIGPLNFSLAKPITKTETDKTQTFQFSLGTTF